MVDAAPGNAGALRARLQSACASCPDCRSPPAAHSWLEENVSSGGSTVSGPSGARAACPASLAAHRWFVGALAALQYLSPAPSRMRCSWRVPVGALAAALLRSCTCSHPAPPRHPALHPAGVAWCTPKGTPMPAAAALLLVRSRRRSGCCAHPLMTFWRWPHRPPFSVTASLRY